MKGDLSWYEYSEKNSKVSSLKYEVAYLYLSLSTFDSLLAFYSGMMSWSICLFESFYEKKFYFFRNN